MKKLHFSDGVQSVDFCSACSNSPAANAREKATGSSAALNSDTGIAAKVAALPRESAGALAIERSV